MNVLKDLLRKKSTESQATIIEPDKSPPKPANALEKIVYDAPPAVVQLKETEDQLREVALRTMAYFEAARAEKGNFCLTLGEGDKRALLLVSPVEGIKAKDVVGGLGEHTVTRTDYVLLTAEGPRRMSFSQVDSGPLYTGDKLKTRNDSETMKEEKFKRIVGQQVKKGGVGTYQEWPVGDGDIDVNFSIEIPESKSDSDRFHINTRRYKNDQFINTGASGIIRDDVTPLQALKNSLNSVQSPLKAKMSEAQAQIRSIRAVGQGLK